MVVYANKQRSFNAGIFSPKLFGQDNLAQYRNANYDSHNMICTKYGPITARTGTQFIREVKNSLEEQNLIEFKFSLDKNFLLEFGNNYIRFHTFDETGFGTVANPSDPLIPYEISTNYNAQEATELDVAQVGNVLYIAHENHRPAKLTRVADDNWTLENVVFIDGPYLDSNVSTDAKLTPSAVTGTGITITASGVGFAPFTTNDIGRYIRINNSATGTQWGYAVVTGYTSSTVVTANVIKDFAATTATVNWRLGAWSPGLGYPKTVVLHQYRLIFAGGKRGSGNEQYVWGSKQYNYEDFSPSDIGGTVVSSSAVIRSIASKRYRQIKYLRALNNALILFTDDSEVSLFSSGATLTPSDMVTREETFYGISDTAQPIEVDSVLMFAQRLGRKVRSLGYDYSTDSFKGPDITLLAENLTLPCIKQLVVQREPNNIVWARLNDGTVLGLTYDKEQEVYGWHRHTIADGFVTDLAVLQSTLYGQDILFMVVRRTINGTTAKYIEMLSPVFSDAANQEDATFLDSSLRYTGDTASTISGLSHLEGKTVTVINEGATEQTHVVQAGSVTLDTPTTNCVIGLPYEYFVTPIQATSPDPIRFGDNISASSITDVVIYVLRSAGILVKQDGSNSAFKPLITRRYENNMDEATPLYSGKIKIEMAKRWDLDKRVTFKGTPGLPFTLVYVETGLEYNA